MTQLRRGLRENADLVIACTLALALTVEVALFPTARPALAVPACLLAALPQIWRRTHPIAAFLGSLAGIFAIHAAAPGWNADAVSFMVLFFLALYSLGAWSRGVEVPISAGIVVVCIVLFALSDGDTFHPADVIFATGFVGWTVGRGTGDPAPPRPRLAARRRQRGPAGRPGGACPARGGRGTRPDRPRAS